MAAKLEFQVAPTARGKVQCSGSPGVVADPFPENTEGNSLFWKKPHLPGLGTSGSELWVYVGTSRWDSFMSR